VEPVNEAVTHDKPPKVEGPTRRNIKAKNAKYGKVVKRRQSLLCRLSPSKSGPEVNQTETSLASQEGDTDHD
jgi:hypothetical protein